MNDLKWTRRHENDLNVENVDDIGKLKKVNHIIVLPKDPKIKEAINTYIESSDMYVECMHGNSRDVLDGFIGYNKNMNLLSNECGVRKVTCDKLFDIYNTNDSKRSNQSFTSIASSLFKQQVGYHLESSYNLRTRKMFDDFYSRVLQYCSMEDIPDNVVKI